WSLSLQLASALRTALPVVSVMALPAVFPSLGRLGQSVVVPVASTIVWGLNNKPNQGKYAIHMILFTLNARVETVLQYITKTADILVLLANALVTSTGCIINDR
ncbi:hypothetical protein INT43_003053, partial [Umbelopsis isabellina]